MSEAGHLGKLTDPSLPNEVIARGRFLFGDEIVDALRKLHTLVVQLKSGTSDAATQMDGLFDELTTRFSKYMRMEDLPP